MAPLLLLLLACGDPLCDTPLYAHAGSDTGTAIAVDTMARRWGATVRLAPPDRVLSIDEHIGG